MKTEFVPKLVATATVCCLVAVVMSAADNLLTVKALTAVGYFESLVSPVGSEPVSYWPMLLCVKFRF